MNCKRPPEGQAWGRTRASKRPPGQGEAAPIPRGETAHGKGASTAPRAPPAQGRGDAAHGAGKRPPPASAAPHSRGPHPALPVPGRDPSSPPSPLSPPHSPRGAATSPCRAGVGAAPAREGGRGREGAAAAPSVPLHVPGAGQPRKRGRGGGGGHGATSHPAAEVAGARARRERARAAREEPLPLAGGEMPAGERSYYKITQNRLGVGKGL